jgi:hypothetical protein
MRTVCLLKDHTLELFNGYVSWRDSCQMDTLLLPLSQKLPTQWMKQLNFELLLKENTQNEDICYYA